MIKQPDQRTARTLRATEQGHPIKAGEHTDHARLGSTILRFLPAERILHWALAGLFMLLYATALGMVIFYAEPSPRHFRASFAWLHRAFGAGLIVLPPIALLWGIRDWRLHLENMKEGWRWRREDILWLILFPRSTMDKRVVLPEQGKFNAAEKLNFMMVSATYPFYILTGLAVWMPRPLILAFLAHFAVAILGLPLVLGHIFMAVVNPSTRIGLSGMVTGWVDREWAKHHYRRWFRERIEVPERQRIAQEMAARLAKPSRVKCVSCPEVAELGSWRELIQRSFQADPVFCKACEAPIPITRAERSPRMGEAILKHLESRGAEVPFDPRGSMVA